jgi:hypothetical protein
VRVREAAGKGRLVGLLACLAALPSCGSGPVRGEPVVIPDTPAALRRTLAEIEPRKDPEAARARARIYARLRELEDPGSTELLARGDAADVEVLSQPGPPEFKSESAGRLAKHFRDRGATPALCRSALQGPLGGPLRKFVLFTIAASFGEVASRGEYAMALDRLAAAAQEIADAPPLKPEAREPWRARAAEYARRAEDLRSSEEPREPGPEARSFSEQDFARHLEEAARAADAATREKAQRGDPERVLESYLLALAHYVLVRECLPEPSPADEKRLESMELVTRSLCDLLCAQP